MIDWILLKQAIIPAIYIVGGLLIGLVAERVLMARLGAITSQTKWRADDLAVKSFKGIIVFLFFVAGVYFALLSVRLDPALLQFLQKLLLFFVIGTGTVFISRFAAGLVDIYGEKAQGIMPSTSIITNLTKLSVFAVGGLIAMQSIGVSITPILTALGVGGLAVALALQPTLSNLFSGLQILATNHVKPGDYIKLSTGEEGVITDITWRNTTLRALQNNLIIIPNSKLADTIITNYTLPDKELAVLVQVGVSYDSDLDKVEAVTIETAKEIMRGFEGGIPEFEPFIRYNSFSDSSIGFTVILRGREFIDQYLIKHEFIKRLHERYRAENIEIPFPIRTVHLKNVQNFKPV
jgi:small-conductance mechanosensitive channel